MVYLRGVRAASTCLILAGLAGLAGLATGGCGYKLVRYRSAGGEPRLVAVHTLENDSLERGYGGVVTDALLRELLRRGALRVVGDAEQADLVISGSVIGIRTEARTFSSVVLALEYEVTVGLDLSVVRRAGGELEIPPDLLVASEFYTASADIEAMRKNREEALRRVAAVLASRVHDSLSEGFPE